MKKRIRQALTRTSFAQRQKLERTSEERRAAAAILHAARRLEYLEETDRQDQAEREGLYQIAAGRFN